MKPNKEKRKGGIIAQVAVLFAFGVFVTGLIVLATQHQWSYSNIKLQAETRSDAVSNEVSAAVQEYPAYPWLLNYWYEHSDELEIEYDADYNEGPLTEEKCRIFIEHNPGLQLKYLDSEDVSGLSQEDQKLYAEICYSWLITHVNQIKRAQGIDYLFCVLTEEPYERQFFLFSAADPDSVRGTNYEEVYPLGTVVQEAEQFDDLTMLCLEYKGKGCSEV